jgi:CubicO group peptidase (beta-lactamase class C family)
VIAPHAACYVYEQPESVDGDWAVGTLEDVGIGEGPICEAVQRILDGTYERVHGLLIIKDGLLVLEEYFRGSPYLSPTNWGGQEIQFSRTRVHNLGSLTKSITSVLTGAAIANGFIADVEQCMMPYFPEFSDLSTPENEAITIEHLLTMTPGWDWDESTLWVSENDMVQFNVARSPLRYLISQPSESEPGATWTYNGAAVTLLGKILERASGFTVERFANEFLFGPLGIRSYSWPTMRSDLIATHGDLKLRPRDIAKIGRLMLNDGVWNGERLLPEGWVEASVSACYEFKPGEGFFEYTDYGYLWWLMDVPVGGARVASYTAAGWGGQRLIVIPDYDTIVVFTGGNYDSYEPVDEMMVRHILPALAGG